MIKMNRPLTRLAVLVHVLLWSATLFWLGWLLSAEWQQITDSIGYGLVLGIIPLSFLLYVSLSPLFGSRRSIVIAAEADILVSLICIIPFFAMLSFTEIFSYEGMLILFACSSLFTLGIILLRSQNARFFDGYCFSDKGENTNHIWPWGQ